MLLGGGSAPQANLEYLAVVGRRNSRFALKGKPSARPGALNEKREQAEEDVTGLTRDRQQPSSAPHLTMHL